MIDANLVPKLLEILSNAEFEVKKEAAWAIANMTDGGTPEQLNYLVQNVRTLHHNISQRILLHFEKIALMSKIGYCCK